MAQWVTESEGGRERGPIALARAWFEVLVRPQRFFPNGVAPGDQAPGLVFAVTVVLIEETSRALVVALAGRGIVDTGPFVYPQLVDLSPVGTLLFLLGVVVLVAPVILHLVAALQTVLLIPFAPERGGVSETVQVIAYATAPCVFAGVPLPEVRVVCALWGIALYVYGTSVVHDVSVLRALVLAIVPAALVFGYGFRAVPALEILLGS